MTQIAISELTESTLDGIGVFDVLMRANKVHLDSEFDKNRIKGSEYSTVYLGSLDTVMRTAMEFLLVRQKISLEAELLGQQILLAQAEVLKANAQVELTRQQTLNAIAEFNIITGNAAKVAAEVLHIGAQTAHVTQQTVNTTLEADNIPKQGLNLTAQHGLITQQALNEVTQNTVLIAQECKLRAEYDLTMQTTTKAATENTLLGQKVTTERAQTQAIGIDENSVIGKQKALYQAQTHGFTRDAEQKAAKLLVDTWNARRMTDEDTIAGQAIDPVTKLPTGIDNGLGDANIARVINRLIEGVGA